MLQLNILLQKVRVELNNELYSLCQQSIWYNKIKISLRWFDIILEHRYILVDLVSILQIYCINCQQHETLKLHFEKKMSPCFKG